MAISAKGEYAARAMMHLALKYGNGSLVKAEDIAHEQCIPKKYLEQILLLFKNKALVTSKSGSNGGYALARHPSEITMADVIRIIDGPLAPMLCVSITSYIPCSCTDETRCALRTVWQEARDKFVEVLENITLQDVVNRAIELEEKRAMMYYI